MTPAKTSGPFEVIPAIDLRGGRCVRLYQGDFQRETVFADDPVAVARRWEAAGAPRIHVVDLDAAAGREPRNAAVVEAIVRAVAIPLQVGGGLRTLEAVSAILGMGAQRAVLGTAAAEDQELLRRVVERHGEAIVVSVDARAGRVATHGWKRAAPIGAAEVMRRMAALGVGRFVYTEISRDGTLQGPNFQACEEALQTTSAKLIASGGVSSLEDILRLKEIGLEGAIVGTAIYTGKMDLQEAIALAAGPAEAP